MDRSFADRRLRRASRALRNPKSNKIGGETGSCINFLSMTRFLFCWSIGCVCLVVAGCAGPPPEPAVSPAVVGRYSHTLHDRFYEAWQHPASIGLPRGRISVPVDVTIDNTGRILRFRIVKSSGNERIDSSIAAVGKTVTRVAPPPGTTSGKPFQLRIYFELDIRA
jgi:TonB family protein